MDIEKQTKVLELIQVLIEIIQQEANKTNAKTKNKTASNLIPGSFNMQRELSLIHNIGMTTYKKG